MLSFETVYGWLNEFDNGSHLDDAVQRIIDNMQNALGRNEYSRVHALIQLSIQVSKSLGNKRNTVNDWGRAETYLECARACYVMGDLTRAINDFRHAASLYMMGNHSHNEAISRWLLGCALWKHSDQGFAIVEWQLSCRIFQNLKKETQWADWYDTKNKQMCAALNTAIDKEGWFGD